MAINLSNQTTSRGGQATGGNLQSLQRALGAAAVGKGQYGTAFDIFKSDVSGVSQAEKDEQRKISAAKQIVANLRTEYFGNKLHKGRTTEGWLDQLVGGNFDRGNPYYRYRKTIKSVTARLAKAYGDTGNIAYQEQLNQVEALPDALYDKKDAEKQFDKIEANLSGKPLTNY